MNFTRAYHDKLRDAMDFDHVIQVTALGDIEHGCRIEDDANTSHAVYAPEVCINGGDDITPIVPDGWELLNGYSGQFSYAGPIMHASEYIGGKLADDILSEPGVYVCVEVTDLSATDDEDPCAGWAVARATDESVL